jgi:hypothetical protein
MTNVQDGTVVHVDHDAPTVIEDYVTIGHACIIPILDIRHFANRNRIAVTSQNTLKPNCGPLA